MQQIQEFLSYAVAGLLGLLWWDLRGFRKQAFGLREEFHHYRLEMQKERESFREEINGKYLSERTHKLMCPYLRDKAHD